MTVCIDGVGNSSLPGRGLGVRRKEGSMEGEKGGERGREREREGGREGGRESDRDKEREMMFTVFSWLSLVWVWSVP